MAVHCIDFSITTRVIPALTRIETAIDVQSIINYCDKCWMVSVYSSVIYLVFIFLGRRWMEQRKPYILRNTLFLWNVGLAVFSFIGMTATVPNIISNIYYNSLSYVSCHSDCTSEAHKRLVLWGWLFALSKIVEFGDTAFIIFRKAPLSFLHWYHHVTVCTYTWYALTTDPIALSNFFGAMNYIVHTFMYAYYAIKMKGYKLHPNISRVITVLQLSQMFAGVCMITLSWYTAQTDSSCMFRYDLFYLASAMYTSYAILFVNFFYQRYIKKAPKKYPTSEHTNGGINGGIGGSSKVKEH